MMPRLMASRTRAPVTAICLLLPAVCFAWGFDGHRRLAAHLQDPLPSGSCLRQWISANQTYANQDKAADPDRWRIIGNPGYDAEEWPRHYLEIDRSLPPESYPREWAQVEQRFGKYAAKNGSVPWRVEEYYARLVDAFRRRDNALAVTTLFHFSHYVTDSFSLLHDTRNFDPNGLHARWESDMLDVNANLDGITALTASYVGTIGRADPRYSTFDIVLAGNALVPQLLDADVASKGDLKVFYASVKDLTARRWGDALTLMASFVGSAWIDAGQPRLPGMSSSCSAPLPQGEVVLKGFPVPGGWTDPKAVQPDAGSSVGDSVDAGGPEQGDAADGGTSREPPLGDGESEGLPEGGCAGCAGGPGAIGWSGLLLLGALRRWSRARRKG